MGILTWILLGLVAGALAKFIMPGKDPGGFIVTTLIGIAGAMVGGFLGSSSDPARRSPLISAASSSPPPARSSC